MCARAYVCEQGRLRTQMDDRLSAPGQRIARDGLFHPCRFEHHTKPFRRRVSQPSRLSCKYCNLYTVRFLTVKNDVYSALSSPLLVHIAPKATCRLCICGRVKVDYVKSAWRISFYILEPDVIILIFLSQK